jgi:hypothetical protein
MKFKINQNPIRQLLNGILGKIQITVFLTIITDLGLRISIPFWECIDL